MPVSKKEISECPIDAMLSVIDGRWKGTILWRLSEGPMRTSESAPQHSWDHRKDVDPPSAGIGAGWNLDPAPVEYSSPVRAVFHLRLRNDVSAGA